MGPGLDDIAMLFRSCDQTALVRFLELHGLLVCLGNHGALFLRDVEIGSSERDTRQGRVLEAQLLDRVEHHNGAAAIEVLETVSDNFAEAALILLLVVVGHADRQRVIEHVATDGGFDQRILVQDLFDRAAIIDEHALLQRNADQGVQIHDPGIQGHQRLFEAAEDLALAGLAFFGQRQEVATKHDILVSRDDRIAVGWTEDVVG